MTEQDVAKFYILGEFQVTPKRVTVADYSRARSISPGAEQTISLSLALVCAAVTREGLPLTDAQIKALDLMDVVKFTAHHGDQFGEG